MRVQTEQNCLKTRQVNLWNEEPVENERKKYQVPAYVTFWNLKKKTKNAKLISLSQKMPGNYFNTTFGLQIRLRDIFAIYVSQ